MNELSEIAALRDELRRLLRDALQAEERRWAETDRRDAVHTAELSRRDELHIAETGRRDGLHLADLARREQLHVDEVALLAAAIESRDIIGQAKGVLMATMGCTAEEAFQLLKTQSQHLNRKIVDIAAEVAASTQRRGSPGATP